MTEEAKTLMTQTFILISLGEKTKLYWYYTWFYDFTLPMKTSFKLSRNLTDHKITCNDLSASALAVLGSLNDSWEIQELSGKKARK